MTELLAPAGDVKSFDAAIACGADAIYLGLSNFNARMKADNFNADNLAEHIARAHFFGVKVYVAVNTIILNDEMNVAVELVRKALDAGADAFIVQDLGFAALLKRQFEGIRLHASTQLGVHNLYGALMAERMGFCRVVLSRETKLEDIKRIKQGTSLELECFVQGALCVAFSGNCYMSAVEQGASGNRGLCKQMCRLPYEAEINGKRASGFLLSARDLGLEANVSELIDAGVTSFKIEGRMRRANYVGQAVLNYRKLIDGGKLSLADEEAMRAAFSRGEYLRRGYLDPGVPDGVINAEVNNHSGLYLGTITDVRKFKNELCEVTLRSDREIRDGDGIKLYENGSECASLGVGGVRRSSINNYTFITAAKLRPGQEARLIFDASNEEEIFKKRLFNVINVYIKAKIGEKLLIKATYVPLRGEGKNTISTWREGDALEAARGSEVTAEQFVQLASRGKDFGFITGNCEVETNGVFVAKSVVNALRREVFSELRDKIVAANRPPRINERVDGETHRGKRKTLGKIYVVRQPIRLNLNERDIAMLCPNEYSEAEIRRLEEGIEGTVALQLPVIANGKDIRMLETLLERTGIKLLVSENIYGLYFSAKGYNVIAGAGHNIANNEAYDACLALGAAAAVPSAEYPTSIDGEVYCCDGELPLMTFAHCPYKTVFKNTCDNCSYVGDMTIKRENHSYIVRRTRLAQCYFGLFPTENKYK